VEAGLVGDSKESLQALLPLLHRNGKRGFLERAQRGMRNWRESLERQTAPLSTPMKPQLVAAELSKRLPADAIVNCDSGTVATWWARHILAKRGQKHTVSGTLASMACGLPYAIAAQIAFPDRMCVTFIGDGGFAMLLGELATAVRYRLPLKIVVLKNNSLE